MNTVESSVIVPIFAMLVVALVLFNVTLHNRIVEKSRDYRVDYQNAFQAEKGDPQGAIRAYWAVMEVIGNE